MNGQVEDTIKQKMGAFNPPKPKKARMINTLTSQSPQQPQFSQSFVSVKMSQQEAVSISNSVIREDYVDLLNVL